MTHPTSKEDWAFSTQSKKVLQLDLDNNIIKEYDSVLEADKTLDML